ncbi:MAG TPA: CPBP family intramembrane glutamic endopeptidase [Chitinophagaceae bacterium]
MVGIIVQLAISWLLIWVIEKKDLSVLGLKPTRQRIFDLGLFFIVTGCCAGSGFLIRMCLGERWELNPDFTLRLLAEGLWWNIKSVLFEELIFRGVILYILIKRTGMLKGIIISAIAFGIYHWFTYEVLGNTTPMITVFLITGLIGLLYGYGYAKTFSLYIPIGIHIGWNFTNNFIFSEGQIGNGVLVAVKTNQQASVSYFIFFMIIFLPMLTMTVVNYLLIRRKKQVVLDDKK